MNISQLEDELKELNNKYMELMDEIERIKIEIARNHNTKEFCQGLSYIHACLDIAENNVILESKLEKKQFLLDKIKFIESIILLKYL
jgi:hypothetical protein